MTAHSPDSGDKRSKRTRAGAPASDPALLALLRARFGLGEFRPNQEAVCAAVAGGRDVLLVMPTGAGKSLCYQLPGIARGGTTLVISPLIALIDDQVARLRGRGFRVEALHSGRDRESLRRASVAYLEGRLDFLFVAPERFAVPRFTEMLLKRNPSLIAVDEAHCISQWGHDFRPDYRLLGERIGEFRPAPVIALTATATPEVQDDIVAQLRLAGELRSIHGFWRGNLAVELAESSPDDREERARRVLKDRALRPAIVYAATRKKAELMASVLKAEYKAAFYHAGLEARERERVQREFLDGKLEVIVATVAFGMGIDKADVRTVIHSALPGSLEGYYQEIGRAGRDGKLARAILLHSRADEQTQLYLHNLNYPDPSLLERVLAKLPLDERDEPKAAAEIARELRMTEAEVQGAVQKLIVHGAVRGENGGLARGRTDWLASYQAQRSHKLTQLAAMSRYAEGKVCRMSALVRYFGADDEAERRCGHCDVCAPGNAVAADAGDDRQDRVFARTLHVLYQLEDSGSAKLYQTAIPDNLVDRRGFDHMLGEMEKAGWITLSSETFEKDGKEIPYTKVRLTFSGKEEAVRAKPDIKIWVLEKRAAKGERGGKQGRGGGGYGRRSGRFGDRDSEYPQRRGASPRFGRRGAARPAPGAGGRAGAIDEFDQRSAGENDSDEAPRSSDWEEL